MYKERLSDGWALFSVLFFCTLMVIYVDSFTPRLAHWRPSTEPCIRCSQLCITECLIGSGISLSSLVFISCWMFFQLSKDTHRHTHAHTHPLSAAETLTLVVKQQLYQS